MSVPGAIVKHVAIATKSDGKQVFAVEVGATLGAVVGVNLMLLDGTVLRAQDILNSFVEGDDNDLAFTYWRLIQEIPQNIIELAKLTGSGFAWRNPDGTWRLRKVGRQVIAFAFGDASPAAIYTPAVDAVFTLCRVDIDTSFNGTSPSISVGTDMDPELLMPIAENAPGFVAGYEATPDKLVLAGVDLKVTINPGAGGSAGSGRIVLDSIPMEGI